MALKNVTTSHARPLPVILLLDVSGSMSVNGKIDALNRAITEMLQVFADESAHRTELQVALITFGGHAAIHTPLTPAREVSFTPLRADGLTPLGQAFTLLQGMLEDPAQVPSRAYRPTVVLVSDGQPNDAWQEPLKSLLASSRASKAFRLAMGIGEDADLEVLRRFLDDPAGRVFEAKDARQLHEFFRWVTMSVTARSRSVTPDQQPDMPASSRISLTELPLMDVDNLEF